MNRKMSKTRKRRKKKRRRKREKERERGVVQVSQVSVSFVVNVRHSYTS